jgi:hypothetical protein
MKAMMTNGWRFRKKDPGKIGRTLQTKVKLKVDPESWTNELIPWVQEIDEEEQGALEEELQQVEDIRRTDHVTKRIRNLKVTQSKEDVGEDAVSELLTDTESEEEEPVQEEFDKHVPNMSVESQEGGNDGVCPSQPEYRVDQDPSKKLIDRIVAAATARNRARNPQADAEEDRSGDDFDMGEDFVDNLTFHEDSLSVMKGSVSTPNGEEIPVWVTTDSGSMVQLMQYDFAKRLKLKVRELRARQFFSISSPGGGKDNVTQFVTLPLKLKAKPEGEGEAGQVYDSLEAAEEDVIVPMKFALCDSLPVPVLWGGKQMRDADLLDYHRNKVLSMLSDGRRIVTQSMSWLAAATEMSELRNSLHRKVYK